jgi:hypothetical protein
VSNGRLKFAFHPASFTAHVVELSQIHEYAGELASLIDNLVPEGRQKSIAFTELEAVVCRCVRAFVERG